MGFFASPVCVLGLDARCTIFKLQKHDEEHNFIIFRKFQRPRHAKGFVQHGFVCQSGKSFPKTSKNQNLVFIKADCIFFNNSKHIQARGTRQYIDPSRSRNTYKATSRDALLLSDFKTSRDSHTLAYSRPPRFLNTNFFLFRWIKVISRTKRRLIPTKPSQDVSSCGDVKPEKKRFSVFSFASSP